MENRAVVCGSVAFVLIASMTMASCRGPSTPEPSGTPAASDQASDRSRTQKPDHDDAPSYFYSPFVVKLDGGVFHTVSFKDVGLDRDSKAASDPLLEVISQSFAYEVARRDGFDSDPKVVYDEEILDPVNHLACGEHHLYIDVWNAAAPARWGYSLWASCGSANNFAWREVPNKRSSEDLTDYVEPLTSNIVDSLVEAKQKDCFQKSC